MIVKYDKKKYIYIYKTKIIIIKVIKIIKSIYI